MGKTASDSQIPTAQKLSPINVLATSFGCIIGWGSFVMPGTNFLPDAGPIGTIIAIFIGGIFFIIIAKTYAYMIEQFPNNGGSFGIVYHVLDKPHAFLTIWSFCFAYIALLWINAINFAPFTRFLVNDVFQWGIDYTVVGYQIYLGEALVELFILIFFGLFVAYGKKLVNIVQTTLFLLLITSETILFFSILLNTDLSILSHPAFIPGKPIPLQIYNVLLFVPWMFVGFGTISFASNDFNFPIKKINCIMPLAIVLGMLDYCMLNTIAATAIPDGFSTNAEYIANLDKLNGIEKFPVLYSVTQKFGTYGSFLIWTAIFCALSSSMIGFYRALANIVKSLSDAKLLPQRYNAISKDGTPRKAIFLIMALSVVIPFIGKNVTGWLTDATSISATIAYAYMSYCCILVSSKNKHNFNKILAIISLIISLMFFLIPLMTSMFFENVFDTESYFILAIWGLIGYGITVILTENTKS